LSTLINLCAFGALSMRCLLIRIWMTKSLGSLRRMSNTRPSRHMIYNSWVLLYHTCTIRFGRLGLLQSTNLLLGLLFKIGFGRRSVWKRGDAKIVSLYLYANMPRNRCTTSSSIAATLYIFWQYIKECIVLPEVHPT
jgi:hypothetical protein